MSNPKPEDEMIGKSLAQFTLLEEIGRGGMATVYSAMQKSMNRKVAVKVLPQHFMHDPDFLERFEREVEVISSLEHPHILPIYDYGEADGVPFIAMRFLGGGSMAQMVRRGVTRLEDLVKPFKQVADALDYAHQQGIIHRDLKPGNIMLDEHGNAYLSDFGIARVMGSNLTGSAIIGTPAYMSPEQAHGVNIDARSDIYSLGIVLFELITGREPYQAETPMSLLLKHINEPVPPIDEFRQGVPPLMQDVVNTATAKNPDDRYSSASDMARAFEEAFKGNRTATTKVGVDTRRDPLQTVVEEKLTPLPNQGGTLIGKPDDISVTGHQTTGAVAQVTASATDPATVQTGGGLSLPMIAGVIVALVIVLGGGAFFLTDGFGGNTPSAPELPANFSLVDAESYRVGIPRAMLPAVDDYIDQSSPDRILHRWQTDDAFYVTIALVNADRVDRARYDATYYAVRDWQVIDDAQADDGTQRISYRIEDDAELDNGQVDVFYRVQNGFLLVVEMYTADSVASDFDLIADFQTILDSIQLTS
ncbi:MAG: serine/threonine protein kinase [Anaerolineae bacterium]